MPDDASQRGYWLAHPDEAAAKIRNLLDGFDENMAMAFPRTKPNPRLKASLEEVAAALEDLAGQHGRKPPRHEIKPDPR